MNFKEVSPEAEIVLKEILEHENEGSYWSIKYSNSTVKEKLIINGCLKELADSGLITVRFAGNSPYTIFVLKDGYFYEEHKEATKSKFERKLNELLKRAETISTSLMEAPTSYNELSDNWMDDVQIFSDKYLCDYQNVVLMRALLSDKEFHKVVWLLKKIREDDEFVEKMSRKEKVKDKEIAFNDKEYSKYDVFISHASRDKIDVVEDLFISLRRLGINIFYDKEEISWGDNWKEVILNGTNESEFAIIVISEHFFGREWTERELNEFLNRQNRSGQKTILPIIHNITLKQLKKKYPEIADIQAISTKDYSCDQIALMFAKEFIKRIRMM